VEGIATPPTKRQPRPLRLLATGIAITGIVLAVLGLRSSGGDSATIAPSTAYSGFRQLATFPIHQPRCLPADFQITEWDMSGGPSVAHAVYAPHAGTVDVWESSTNDLIHPLTHGAARGSSYTVEALTWSTYEGHPTSALARTFGEGTTIILTGPNQAALKTMARGFAARGPCA
jgi:hypothetical protein